MQLYPNSSRVYTPADTFLLYQNQWISTFTRHAGVTAATDKSEAAKRVAEAVTVCAELFDQNFKGRVLDEDKEFVAVAQGDDVVIRLRLRLPTVLGEFSDIDDAEAWIRSHRRDADADGGIEIVVRGSARDKQLSDYSKIMLPAD